MNYIGATTASAIGAELRQLDLLREIADAGGTIAPEADPHAARGYAYATKSADVEHDLALLAKRNYLEARFFDRVSLCPKCGSHHLNVREICPSCRRANIVGEGLLHHFRCGYVAVPSEFARASDGGYRCPKCNREMHHLGVEYDRLGRAFQCRGCGMVSENPPVEAVCFACGARTPAENLVSAAVFSYVLTSRGAEALREGSLFGDEDEPLQVADAPVYRRAVILEFLEHEMKRARQTNGAVTLLLAKCSPEAAESGAADALAKWLIRLRQGLREVDLLGQVADQVYVAILTSIKRRDAEALRRRIESDLGPQSPFALSIIETNERERAGLVRIIAGGGLQDEH